MNKIKLIYFPVQGRIEDFAQGGARYKIFMYTMRSSVPFSREAENFFGVRPPPPINIIMINTLGKTHIKKWSDEWSEPLRKKTIFFYDLKENHRTLPRCCSQGSLLVAGFEFLSFKTCR